MKDKIRAVCSQLSFFLITVLVFQVLLFRAESRADHKTFGLLAGLNFPKMAFAKADLNVLENFGVDYQISLGIFWSIQQTDVLYYFSRGIEWSPYVGLGYQNWNFYGFSSSTNYNGVVFGSGSQAVAITVPLGLTYIADNGFAFNISVAADVFTIAPVDLRGRVIPEAGLGIGYYF